MLRSRQRVSSSGWRLSYCPSASSATSAHSATARFSVVVAKRHVRHAVLRNRIRRLLREYFRQELQPLLPAMDYVLQTTRPPLLPIVNARLRSECRCLFSRAIDKPL